MDHILTTKVDNVRLVDPFSKNKYVNGTLHLTTTHLIFVDPLGAKEAWILHSHVASVDKLPLTTAGSPMKIRCKTFRSITFVISKERVCADIYASLVQLCTKPSMKDLYAFDYKPLGENIPQNSGWQMYDAVREFERMEIPKELWTRSKINEDYNLCPTYPSVLYVPSSATEVILLGSAQFRSKGRLPVLSYYHKDTKAAICRCAQPLSGFNARCPEDEQMLQAIIKSNPAVPDLYIIDTRPKINAMANRAAGKGYENVDNYENVKFHFIGIENIHVMRQSLQKLIDVCENTQLNQSAFLSGLDSCGYLKHIKSILDTSCFISKAVDVESSNVLVHCSDGWDRTAQTCSLAGILLNPYYRTIHGLQVLIEKEWLSFGHKFVHRCGLLSGDPKEVSPIFTQFIDCVWQLTQQYPTAFEFNERFLIALNDHVYSCQFGTFLGNCERERREAKLSERTYSVWGYMWQHISEYINPFYKDGNHGVLRPSTAMQQIRFWIGLYNRHDNELQKRESILDGLTSIIDHNDSLKDHVRLLSKRIEILKLLKESKQMKSQGTVVGSDDVTDVNEIETSGPPMPTKDESTAAAVGNPIAATDESVSEAAVDPIPVMDQSTSVPDRDPIPVTDQSTSAAAANPVAVTGESVSVAAADSAAVMDQSTSVPDGDPIPVMDQSTSVPDRDPIPVTDQSTCVLALLKEKLTRLGLTEKKVLDDLPEFAIDWKSVQDMRQCRCGSPIDFVSRKYHCWNCGDVFCLRCINQQCALPSHYSENKVPVCKPCYKSLK